MLGPAITLWALLGNSPARDYRLMFTKLRPSVITP